MRKLKTLSIKKKKNIKEPLIRPLLQTHPLTDKKVSKRRRNNVAERKKRRKKEKEKEQKIRNEDQIRACKHVLECRLLRRSSTFGGF